MKTKFTPGPWEYSPKRDGHDFVIHQKDCVAGEHQIKFENGVVGSSEWIWLEEADAHLIAAAPELYKELEYVLRANSSDMTGGFLDNDEVVAINNVLKKARGES